MLGKLPQQRADETHSLLGSVQPIHSRVFPLNRDRTGVSDVTQCPEGVLPRNVAVKRDPMIRHTVAFTLAHPAGSEKEAAFLEAALVLADIPGVTSFERLRQSSPKNNFDFGFSMEFADQAAYTAYNEHPAHVAFVSERWVVEVTDFLEIDYTPL